MIDRHWDGIAAYWCPENRVALGFVEGLNNKIRVLQRLRAPAYVVGRVEAGECGLAIAYSSMLIAVMLVAVLLIQVRRAAGELSLQPGAGYLMGGGRGWPRGGAHADGLLDAKAVMVR